MLIEYDCVAGAVGECSVANVLTTWLLFPKNSATTLSGCAALAMLPCMAPATKVWALISHPRGDVPPPRMAPPVPWPATRRPWMALRALVERLTMQLQEIPSAVTQLPAVKSTDGCGTAVDVLKDHLRLLLCVRRGWSPFLAVIRTIII